MVGNYPGASQTVKDGFAGKLSDEYVFVKEGKNHQRD
jgi:hypothetical protein